MIVSLSQRLFFNLGPLKAVVDQKASYSVGEAWLPTYNGETDKDNGEIVKKWTMEVFFNALDVRGGQWDWWENLESVSYEIDVRGDHFTLLTTNEDETQPRIQNIPAYAIKTKGMDVKRGVIEGGTYNGRTITHGIIYDKRDKAIAYRVSNGPGRDDFDDIDAAHIIHSFDPSLSDGKRGLPVATHALEDLKHVLQSTEYERTRQLIMSSIGLFIENDTGGPETGDPRNQVRDDCTPTSTGDVVQTQEISPSIWYAKAGEGEKITQLKHEAGGDTFDSFHDRMIRSFVSGARWSYSLVWKPTGQGTAERGEILRARKAVIDRQKRIRKWAIRVLTYAYSFKADRGELPLLDSPMAWSFTKPPRLTVDDGREAKMMEAGYKLGRFNMTDLLEAEGMTIDEFYEIRADEAVKRTLKIKQKFKDTGVRIDPREMVMFTPNETSADPTSAESQGGATPIESTGDQDTETAEEEASRFQSLRSKFDAFGVGVRAGALTPSIFDEEQFRKEGNMPAMSPAVVGAWEQDKGYRRPITLLNEGATEAQRSNRPPPPTTNEDE